MRLVWLTAQAAREKWAHTKGTVHHLSISVPLTSAHYA